MRPSTYEAKFEPMHVENGRRQILCRSDCRSDRPENNRASTTVVSAAQRAILLVESVGADAKSGDHKLLAERLSQGGGAEGRHRCAPISCRKIRTGWP